MYKHVHVHNMMHVCASWNILGLATTHPTRHASHRCLDEALIQTSSCPAGGRTARGAAPGVGPAGPPPAARSSCPRSLRGGRGGTTGERGTGRRDAAGVGKGMVREGAGGPPRARVARDGKAFTHGPNAAPAGGGAREEGRTRGREGGARSVSGIGDGGRPSPEGSRARRAEGTTRTFSTDCTKTCRRLALIRSRMSSFSSTRAISANWSVCRFSAMLCKARSASSNLKTRVKLEALTSGFSLANFGPHLSSTDCAEE